MTVRIIREMAAPMRHEVQVGRNRFATDGSTEEGGEESGPNPHDLYDAALGACKALTMVWYANKKGIPLTDVEVAVERDTSAERSGTYRLNAEITLGGDLTDTQRQDLLRVASKCPVHKLMTEVKTEISTTLAPIAT